MVKLENKTDHKITLSTGHEIEAGKDRQISERTFQLLKLRDRLFCGYLERREITVAEDSKPASTKKAKAVEKLNDPIIEEPKKSAPPAAPPAASDSGR